MEIQITARHFTLTEDLRIHTHEKLNRLEQVFPGVGDIRVVYDLEKNATPSRSAEVVVHIKRHTLTAQEVRDTHEAALDACVEQLRRQLLREKARLRRVDKLVHR